MLNKGKYLIKNILQEKVPYCKFGQKYIYIQNMLCNREFGYIKLWTGMLISILAVVSNIFYIPIFIVYMMYVVSYIHV